MVVSFGKIKRGNQEIALPQTGRRSTWYPSQTDLVQEDISIAACLSNGATTADILAIMGQTAVRVHHERSAGYIICGV